jgi:glutamate---methylamine ligase
MPKPFSHLTGNGCHMHVSLWQEGGDANLFFDRDGELGLSKLCYQFLGGVMHSAPALCFFTNPTVNSYRRINAPVTTSGATWSPNTISYAGNNRTHMIRIPEAGRFELRLPDGAANPYLLPAAILHTGLDGIEQQRSPGRRLDSNMYASGNGSEVPQALPDNLYEAMQAFATGPVLRERLGEKFSESYLKLKRAEWRHYGNHVSAWEVEHTLDC